jgi:transposase InsO family protein
MSDSGNQFRSPSWKRKLPEHEVELRFSPERHPQSNPSERIMNELPNFVVYIVTKTIEVEQIYCCRLDSG